jgi:probable HAF family extracellular repeat protein
MKLNKPNNFKLSLLASLIVSNISISYAASTMDYELEVLKNVGQGTAISSDGSVIGGTYEISDQVYRSFIKKNGQDIDISVLNNDGRDVYITGISDNGEVATGYFNDAQATESEAYVYNLVTGNVTIVGKDKSLKEVSALAVSGDGKTIVGLADQHAYRFSEVEGLSFLTNSNSGPSSANGINYDGSVIVGRALINNEAQAFKYTDAKGAVSLGSLRKNNDGSSAANAVSSNGLVTVGYSDDDNDEMHAFRHTDAEGMKELGTLKKDNTGFSSASAVSHDGEFIVGSSWNEDDNQRGFVYVSSANKMFELSPLDKSLNGGESSAEAISDDGKVVAGYVETNNGETSAVLWKLHYSTGMTPLEPSKPVEPQKPVEPIDPPKPVDPVDPPKPVDPVDPQKPVDPIVPPDTGDRTQPSKPVDPIVPIDPREPTVPLVSDPIDINKTRQSINKMAENGYKILDLYQTALYNLAESRCQMGDSDHCVGLFTQYDDVHQNNRIATGLFGSFRFPAENWTMGGSLNLANHTNLVEGYKTSGNNQPGVGTWLRYQENKDNVGFSSEISAAFLQQGLEISRAAQYGTEAGKGNSKIKGYYASLTASYGIVLNEQTRVTPLAALKYHKVSRAGYTEQDNIDFPATYGRMGNENFDLQLGVDMNHQLTESVELDAGVGADIKLHHKRDAFTGLIQYVNDADSIYDRGDSQSVKPYAQVGVNYYITPNSTLRGNVGYQTTDYQNDGMQVGLSYSYHW